MKFWQLPGAQSHGKSLPESCPDCGCKHYFKQADFRRSLGLGMVVTASLATCVLLALGYNWFTVWSPMFAAVIIDRSLAWASPVVALCYECQHVFRGLQQEQLHPVTGFDLDLYDRIHYAERVGEDT